MDQSLNLPSIAAALKAMEIGELSARELAERCLNRIALRNTAVQAVVDYDVDNVLAQADAVDAGHRPGLLRGIPYAVKDVIETADYPTTFGSAIYTGHKTNRDAACVAMSREQGAVLMGKVATSEFATQSPGATRNPLNLRHTPGGSSSGSVAAVADGMAMAAWGTQTTGSILRPAVYCGVVGYKPSFGLVSTDGVGMLSHSNDTVGILARSVSDAAAFVFGIHRQRHESAPADARFKVGVCMSDQWRYASADAVDALQAWAKRLGRAGFNVQARALPAEYEALPDIQGRVVAFEAHQALAHERLTADEGQLSPRLRTRLDVGRSVTLDEYLVMQRSVARLRAGIEELFDGVDALLYPAADGEAEEGLVDSGSPRFGAPWTILHLPTVAVPLEAGSGGLPLGGQLIGRLGQDAALLQLAERASESSRWR